MPSEDVRLDIRSCEAETLAWTLRSLVCVAFCIALRFLSLAEIWTSHSEIHVLMRVWLISSVPMRLVSALKMLLGSLAARSAAACEGGSGTFGAAAAGAAAAPLVATATAPGLIGPMKRAPSAPRPAGVSPSAPPSAGVAAPVALPLAARARASLKLLGLSPSAATRAEVPLGASRDASVGLASVGLPSAC